MMVGGKFSAAAVVFGAMEVGAITTGGGASDKEAIEAGESHFDNDDGSMSPLDGKIALQEVSQILQKVSAIQMNGHGENVSKDEVYKHYTQHFGDLLILNAAILKFISQHRNVLPSELMCNIPKLLRQMMWPTQGEDELGAKLLIDQIEKLKHGRNL